MNEEQKREYKLSKFAVKKWESEFKKTTRLLPTKADIKCAPLRIRDAYRTYWKLKTLELENTLSDVLNDENAKDCFNSSNETAETSQNETCDSFFQSISDKTIDSSFNIFNESNESKIELLTRQIEENERIFGKKKKSDFKNVLETSNIESVWGSHLNKPKEKVEEDPKKLETKSVSFQYTEKLFKATKFNKRNPRKPLKRNKTVGSLPENEKNESQKELLVFSEPLVSEVPVPETSCSEPLVSEVPVPEKFEFFPKAKIVKANSGSSTSQAVSLLQKKVDGGLKKSISVDLDWLERASESNKLENQDSGFDSLSKTKNESDEDLIESDDDSKSKNILTLNLPIFSDSNPSQEFNFNQKRPLSAKEEPLAKKAKIDIYDFGTTKPEIQAPVKEEPKEIPRDVLVEKKLEQLEKRLKSGKANENFVSINIQKKVYARGKKKMTFSKYKKQKWKQLKQNSESKGVLSCYNCGDVGHYSKSCPNAKKGLVPLEEYDSEDESPFPTLSEAAQMAQEAAEKAHSGKRKFTIAESEVEPVQEIIAKEEIKPVYDIDKSTPKEVFNALKDFGHSSFLPGQEEAIMRILKGQSTLITSSTGSGKSLCYQLPAYIYSKHNPSCITIVISPLISLMNDQVQSVSKCLKIASFHANLTEKKRDAVMEDLKNGNLDVLLLSPEVLVSLDSGFGRKIFSVLPPIAFACIDEAHCLYQWCHNFRPSYMTVTQVLREKLGVKTFLGLTATASTPTIEAVLGHLGMDADDKKGVISDRPLPENLILSVSLINSEEEKQHALIKLLKGKIFGKYESIIIYCTRREQCDRVASFLRTSLQTEDGKNNIRSLSIHAESYHAGLTAGRRNSIQKNFMSGKLRIVVATMAFGMGIDKNDIRGIIHFSLPSTFENYVQEIGRAGRDRQPAHCHLFLDAKKNDLGELKRHIYSNSIDRHTIRKLLEMVFIRCKCTDVCPKHEVAFSIADTVSALDIPQENISTLLAYLELDSKQWIKILPLAYTKCKVTSYKGPNHLKKMAKTCPPLTMAMASQNEEVPKLLDFDVISLSRKINWDSGIVKRNLKDLEWTKENDKPKKTGIVVDFSELGFRVLSPGNLSDCLLDEVLDLLYSKVVEKEKSGLYSLQLLFNSLKKIAYNNIDECVDIEDLERSECLKDQIRNYFTNPSLVNNVELDDVSLENETLIASDIRSFISMHSSENNFTGRSIARILHGIGSPNFPPVIWGRTRFWRLHLSQDFNLLCKLATKMLILMR